jgi:hypothetical protein
MTISSKQAAALFGDPTTERHMRLMQVPTNLQVGAIPRRIYCNRLLEKPLLRALQNIVDRGLAPEVRTWDGCFQIRQQRGSLFAASLHSWGLAIDINAAWNRLGAKPTMSAALVKCFTDAGFEWGGNWRRPDGMHFQLATLPATL